MPRIGGGGKPPPGVPPQTPGVQESSPSEFAKVQQAQTQGTDAARAEQAKQAEQSRLTAKAQQIAKKLARGTVDERGATQEFVELVIEERFPQLKKKTKRKKKGKEDNEPDNTAEERIEEAVTDMIDQDPSLAKRLMNQFNKLAAKG